jgi:hypothetical protein
MTKRDFLSLLLKLMGLYCLFEFIITISTLLGDIQYMINYKQFPQIYPSVYLIGVILSRIWPLGLAYVLCRYSYPIAKRLIANNSEISFGDITQSEKSLFSISIIIIGIGCFVNGVPNIIRILSKTYITRAYSHILSPNYGQISSNTFDKTIGVLVLLALGVYLITGGEHLVALAFREKRKLEPEEPDDRDI